MNFKQISLIRRTLIDELNGLPEQIRAAKREAAMHWVHAEETSFMGREHFRSLNWWRDHLRFLRSRRDLIEATLRDLKRQEKAMQFAQSVGADSISEAIMLMNAESERLTEDYIEAQEQLDKRRAMLENGLI